MKTLLELQYLFPHYKQNMKTPPLSLDLHAMTYKKCWRGWIPESDVTAQCQYTLWCHQKGCHDTWNMAKLVILNKAVPNKYCRTTQMRQSEIGTYCITLVCASVIKFGKLHRILLVFTHILVCISLQLTAVYVNKDIHSEQASCMISY